MIIEDLYPGIIRKLRGRTDEDDNLASYTKAALLDLTQNYEFEELRVTGPVSSFIAYKSEYPKGGSACPFINPGDVKLTFIVTWYCYFNVLPIILGQSLGLGMKGRSPRVVEPMSKISGQPSIYGLVGNNILVGFMPNIAYATQMRYQRQHPFNLDVNLGKSTVFIPEDWQDIIEYAAAEKACDTLGMNEIGMLYHQKLYGSPGSRGRPPQPGLIAERMSMQSRLTTYNEKQLRPVVRPY